MTKLYDPMTGDDLDVYSARGESEAVFKMHDVNTVIGRLSTYLKLDRDEVIRRLQNSDVLNPIMMHDEAFWCQ